MTMSATTQAHLGDTYRQQRWTLVELLDEALDRLNDGRITLLAVDAIAEGLAHEPATTTRTVNVPIDTLDHLDTYAASLRRSRSQFVAAALEALLPTL